MYESMFMQGCCAAEERERDERRREEKNTKTLRRLVYIPTDRIIGLTLRREQTKMFIGASSQLRSKMEIKCVCETVNAEVRERGEGFYQQLYLSCQQLLHKDRLNPNSYYNSLFVSLPQTLTLLEESTFSPIDPPVNLQISVFLISTWIILYISQINVTYNTTGKVTADWWFPHFLRTVHRFGAASKNNVPRQLPALDVYSVGNHFRSLYCMWRVYQCIHHRVGHRKALVSIQNNTAGINSISLDLAPPALLKCNM